MKKVMSIAVAVLVVAAMMVSAFAETPVPSPSVPSVSVIPMNVGECTLYNANGAVCTKSNSLLVISPYEEEDTAPEAVKAALDEAHDALAAVDSLGELIPELEGKDVSGLFHIAADHPAVAPLLAAGGHIDVTIDVVDETADDGMIHFMDRRHSELTQDIADDAVEVGLIHFKDGAWINTEDVVTVENNVITLSLSELGVYAFVVG